VKNLAQFCSSNPQVIIKQNISSVAKQKQNFLSSNEKQNFKGFISLKIVIIKTYNFEGILKILVESLPLVSSFAQGKKLFNYI